MARSFFFASFFVLTTVLGIASARAEEPARNEDKVEQARRLYFEGGRMREEGKLEPALRSFRKAHAMMQVPTTGVEVGRTLMLLKRYVEAADIFLAVVRMPRTVDEPESFSAARDEARGLAAKAESRVAVLRLRWASQQPAALRVSVDGVAYSSKGDKPLRLNPGLHVLEVRGQGSSRREHRLMFKSGEKKVFTVNPFPRAVVSERKVPVGAVVLTGVGAVTLVAGGIVGGVALARGAELNETCRDGACPPPYHGAIDRLRVLSHTSTGLLVAGAAASLAGAGWWTLSTFKGGAAPPSASERASLDCQLGLGRFDIRLRF